MSVVERDVSKSRPLPDPPPEAGGGRSRSGVPDPPPEAGGGRSEGGRSAWTLPERGRVGIAAVIIAESAIFLIFVVAYLFYIGKSASGPQPAEVLELPILASVLLLSSSATIGLAVRALRQDRHAGFLLWWGLTFALGFSFLALTAVEWWRLIYDKSLTIATNLFGTTYYAIVGLHATHVIIGLVGLGLVLWLGLRGHVRARHAERTEVLSLYWHFVDGVWVVVFTVVYVIGR